MSARKGFPMLWAAAAVLAAGCCASSDSDGGRKGPRVHGMDEIASYLDTLKLSVLGCTTFTGRKLTAAERARIEDAMARARTDSTVRVPVIEEIPEPKPGHVYLAVEVELENVHRSDVPRGGARLFNLVRERDVGQEKPAAVRPEARAYFCDRSGKQLALLRPYRLPPGQKTQGWVVFQAPKDVKDWVLRFGTGAGALYIRVVPD